MPFFRFRAQPVIPAQEGGALIEVMVSILMLALGVLAIIGLQATMNANATDAKYRAEASFLADEIVGQMWVDQGNLSKYAIASGSCTDTHAGCTNWLGKVNARLPGGSATIAINGVEVTITVTWKTPGADIPHNYLLVTNVVS